MRNTRTHTAEPTGLRSCLMKCYRLRRGTRSLTGCRLTLWALDWVPRRAVLASAALLSPRCWPWCCGLAPGTTAGHWLRSLGGARPVRVRSLRRALARRARRGAPPAGCLARLLGAPAISRCCTCLHGGVRRSLRSIKCRCGGGRERTLRRAAPAKAQPVTEADRYRFGR